jgi:hypothetical protein
MTTLTALSLAGPVCDDAATPAVAQLTGLRQLCWDALGTVQQNTFPEKAPAVVTVPGLRQLTALRGLTSLELVGCGRITTTTLETLRTVSVGLQGYGCNCMLTLHHHWMTLLYPCSAHAQTAEAAQCSQVLLT